MDDMVMVTRSGTKDDNHELELEIRKDWKISPEAIAAIKAGGRPEPSDPKWVCYECEEECNYLFDDSRCFKCTQMTPEEVVGGYS
jgi:hypothetical protein